MSRPGGGCAGTGWGCGGRSDQADGEQSAAGPLLPPPRGGVPAAAAIRPVGSAAGAPEQGEQPAASGARRGGGRGEGGLVPGLTSCGLEEPQPNFRIAGSCGSDLPAFA